MYKHVNSLPKKEKRLTIKHWPHAPNLWDSLNTRANFAKRVTFFSKMAFGECWRVWRVLPNCLVNVSESGESLPNWLANVGESGESQHFLGFGQFLLAKFAKLQRMNLPCLKDWMSTLSIAALTLFVLSWLSNKKVLACFLCMRRRKRERGER